MPQGVYEHRPAKFCRKCGNPKPLPGYCKPCRAAYMHRFYEEHREKPASNYNDHTICRKCGQPKLPGRCKSCCSRTYRKVYMRSYYENHKEKAARVQAEYYITNRDSSLARSRAWEKANPEFVAARKARRRVALHAAMGSHTTQEWRAIIARQRSKCAICKKRCRLTLDHMIPLSRGGSDLALNIQGLCKSCNSAKHAKELKQYNRSLFDRTTAFLGSGANHAKSLDQC